MTLPGPCEVAHSGLLRRAADAHAATTAGHAPNTLPARVHQLAAILRDQAAISPADTLPDPLTRRRAAKWLARAHAAIPRPHMAAAHARYWLSMLVQRSRALEGELYSRLRGLKLDADPLPEEVRTLSRSHARIKAPITDLTTIPNDWDGEPTVAGDYSIQALTEVLDNERSDSEDPGQPAHRENPHGLPRRQEGHSRPLAPRTRPPCRPTGLHPQGILAPRRGSLPRQQPDSFLEVTSTTL